MAIEKGKFVVGTFGLMCILIGARGLEIGTLGVWMYWSVISLGVLFFVGSYLKNKELKEVEE